MALYGHQDPPHSVSFSNINLFSSTTLMGIAKHSQSSYQPREKMGMRWLLCQLNQLELACYLTFKICIYCLHFSFNADLTVKMLEQPP